MATSEQRKLIRRKIEADASSQQVYDELHGQGNAADETLADLVRNVPTMERRAEYRTQQWALLSLLVLDLAWKLGVVLPAEAQKGWPGVAFQSVFSAAILFAALGVAKYWRRAHAIAASFAFVQLAYLTGPATGSETMEIRMTVLFAAMAIVGWNLQRKLTPDYITLKEPYVNSDGQKRLKRVVRFGDY